MIANHMMPDVGKGSDHATNVAEGWELPSPFAGPSLGLPLKIDEQKEAVGPSSQDLRQMQVRVDDALRAANVALEMSKAFLDRRTKFEELGSGHAGGFRQYRSVGPGEVTQSAKSGSEGSGRRFEHVAEILLGEGLRVPESWMAVDEGFMQGRRGPSEIGDEIASRLIKILVRADLPTQGLTPTVRARRTGRPPRRARSPPRARGGPAHARERPRREDGPHAGTCGRGVEPECRVPDSPCRGTCTTSGRRLPKRSRSGGRHSSCRRQESETHRERRLSLARGNSENPPIRSGSSPLVGTHPPRNVRSSPGAPPPSGRKCCGPPPARTRSDRVERTRSRGGDGGDATPCRGPSHGAGTGRSPQRPIPIGGHGLSR